jgi:hypothetical protein
MSEEAKVAMIIFAVLLGLLMAFLGLRWVVAVGQWHQCGATLSDSVLYAAFDGKPNLSQCVELEFLKNPDLYDSTSV